MSLKRFKSLTIKYLPLILVILLASLLRLWQLGNVPMSMTDDEIRLVYSGFSIAHNGKDAFGNFMPLVFHMDGASTYGQVPIYLTSLFFLFLPLNPFTARLPFALSGIFSVILVYFIVKKILGNDKIALASSFAFSVSVWSLQMTRFAIEIDIAVLLYLAAILTFLYLKNNLKVLILSMLLFFFAFNTYAATKIILIPVLITLVWYKFKDLSKLNLLVILSTIIISFGFFSLLSITQGASNYSAAGGAPFFFLDKNQTSSAVELERRASDQPSMVKNIYHNKFTYWGRTFAINYLTAFSPQYLFLNQESSGIYSIWGRGELYLFELVFLILGLFYLFREKKKEFYLFLFMLLIAPLPSALGIGVPTWTSRSGFMVFGLYSFIGTGIYAFYGFFKDKKFKIFTLIVIFAFYLYGVVGYLFQYYYDWSQTNAKYFSEATKQLVYKIDDYKKEGKKVVVSEATVNTLMHYAFYNQADPSKVQENINKSPIKFDNFIFYKHCLTTIPKEVVYIADVSCKYNIKPFSSIKEHKGSETVWNIYEE